MKDRNIPESVFIYCKSFSISNNIINDRFPQVESLKLDNDLLKKSVSGVHITNNASETWS